MTPQSLKHLSEILQASKEPIATELQEGRLIIQTKKNSLWILISLIGLAFSILLLVTYDRAQYNLEIGLVIFWISIYGFWRMQNINKTLTIDLQRGTLSVIANSFIHRWILSNLFRLDTTIKLDSLPKLDLLYYSNLKYHWTHRIYFNRGLWNIYLLEFEDKATAQSVLNLLKL